MIFLFFQKNTKNSSFFIILYYSIIDLFDKIYYNNKMDLCVLEELCKRLI